MPAGVVVPEVRASRKADYEIAPLLLNRWSPRSMTGEAIPDEELFPVFEAARSALFSCSGELWRFIVARRQHSDEFARFFDFLVPGNRVWAQNAAALVVVVSRTRFEYNDKPATTHAFDAGAAWENLAIEASRRQLVAHGMEGFDYAHTKTDLSIPFDFGGYAMIAIGRAPADNRPEKSRDPRLTQRRNSMISRPAGAVRCARVSRKYRAKKHPNSRRPLREIIFEGRFGRSLPGLP